MKSTVENRPVGELPGEDEYVVPAVNIFETNNEYFVEAEMPGVDKDGLQINLEGNEIAILGRRQLASVNGSPLIRERHGSDFRRVFELDPAIDTSKITAKMEQGLLTLTLPKSERIKPRRISVD